MSGKVNIAITSSANTSGFQQVTRDAEKMANSVDQAGQKSSRSLKEVEDRAKAVGAGLGTLAGGIALSGRAFQDQQQQIRGLNRAYGESSDEIQKFSKELQDSTTYSDDAARQSAQVASTLTRSYGLTAEQVTQLIARTADLASVNVTSTGAQFDLTDAVSRTAGAIRGEGEAAEALGLTLSDSAVAAAAAARGLTGWTTTMTEAEKAQFRFTLLMEQSTYAQGAAAEAADTNAGKARHYINVLQDQAQAFGGLTGAAGEYLSVLGQLGLALPLVGAALGKVTAGMAAAGITGGTAGIAALLAVGGLEAYRTANGQGLAASGNSPELTLWNSFFGGASGVANSLLPGNPFDTSRYSTAGNANDVEDVLKSLFFIDPVATGTNDKDYAKALYDRLITFGVIPQSQYTDSQTGRDEQLDIIKSRAASSGLTLEQFIMSYLNAPGGTAVFDPVSQKYMDKGELQIYTGQRTQLRSDQIAAGATSYVGSPGTNFGSLMAGPNDPYGGKGIYNPFYQIPPNAAITADNPYYSGPGPAYAAGGSAAVANDLYAKPFDSAPGLYASQTGDSVQTSMTAMGGQSVQIAENMTRALKEQLGGWYDLRDGITSTADAQTAFQMINETVITQQQVYSGQISEYSQQQSALTDARDILLQRQQDGVKLTSEEQALLDNYPALYERVTGGVEDATVANGLLAAQYIENMKQGDALNESMQGQTDAVGGLTRIIEEMILAMDGVPTEVKTAILLENADESIEDLIRYQNWLNSIPGYVSTVVDTVFVESGTGSGGRVKGVRLGGVVGYRNGGIPVELAEAGPELLHFRDGGSAWAMDRGIYSVPKGTYVDTAPASKLKAGIASQPINVYGNINVYANDVNQMRDSIRESSIGGSR